MTGKVIEIIDRMVNIKLDTAMKLKEGDGIEIKRMTKKEYTYRKLQALWYLLLAELVKQTGYSQIFWKHELKKNAGYFTSVKEPNGGVSREWKSVSSNESTFDELSWLYGKSREYLIDNEIIDLTEFDKRYDEITGKG